MKIREKAFLGCVVILGGVWVAAETSHHAVGWTTLILAAIWTFWETMP